MNPTDDELAAARECLARLADFAGGDDYLSAIGVRQNVEAVQAAFACPVSAGPDEPSTIVDRMMRRLSAPDLPAVGQHADLVRSLRGHDDPADPIYAAADLLFEVRHHLPPDVLRTLADVWTCASAARYGAPHERFWDADDQWDPFADHDTAECERGDDLDGAGDLGESGMASDSQPEATDA